MVVSGSGFLNNLSIAWNDDLNVIIGGRGAGKSAIIETLRYALDAVAYADQSHREELVRYALGSGGKVEVMLERPLDAGHTRLYRVTRVWGEEPRVVDADTGDTLTLSPHELLGPNGGPTIFGQREIYAVSHSEQYRLALLDELIGPEARERASAVRQSLDQLRANARTIADVRARLIKREEYRQKLQSVEHEIDIYERHGAADKLREATHLRSDGQNLRTAVAAVSRVHKEWQESSQSLLVPLETSHRSLVHGRSKQKAILSQAATVLQEIRNALQQLFDQGNEALGKTEAALGDLSRQWQEALRPLEMEINQIKQEAQTDALDPDRLLRLTEERTALVPLIEELDRVEKQLDDLQQQRQAVLLDVREHRHGENQLRRERAGAISALLQGRLSLQVEFKGQKGEYRQQLASLLQGSRVSQDALDLLVAPEATDGIALAEAVRSGAEEVQKRFALTPGMTNRLVQWLTAEKARLFEVETLIPTDALQVQLEVDGTYRSLDHLSAGQRATAILLLLFALEGRVLILDQPEDDLDNRFVYEDVVQLLRSQKGLKDGKRRQIIAATHNANIPVIGDAELVLALESQENHAHVIGRASIDDRNIRELVKTIMEGGTEAFHRRAEKYGGLL